MKGTHINVLSNYLHDSGAAGINTHSADYITIDGNIVSNNAWYTTSKLFGSGISTGDSVDSGTNAGIKMVIKNNVVYGNTNRPGGGVILMVVELLLMTTDVHRQTITPIGARPL